ncbi:MAG: alpha/beta hydrolase [Acidimicrobiales bacterium]
MSYPQEVLVEVSEANTSVPSSENSVYLPARNIPVPASLSPQAQAIVAMSFGSSPYPPLDDIDAWRMRAAESDAQIVQMIGDRASQVPAEVEEIDLDGVRVYVITPHDLPSDDRRAVLEIHGGAFVSGGGESCRIMGLHSFEMSGVRTWAVDYRMPPDYPYPAPLDDCVTAYRALLRDHRPDDIIVRGASAGGNLAAALILKSRDQGLPLPAAAVLMTPEVDLTESGDSFQTNLGLDNVLKESLMPANLLYAGKHDLTDPYLSPLFADFSKGFPPSVLTTGTRDLFLSNTVRLHRALRSAGVPADLHVVEGAGHAGFFLQAPEDEDLQVEIRKFIDAHWSQTIA